MTLCSLRNANPKRQRGSRGCPRLSFGLVFGFAILLLTGCDGRSVFYQPDRARKQKIPSQVNDFHTLFAKNCSGCHGAGGLQGPAPPIGNPLFLAMISEKQLADIIRDGRHGTLMPPFITTNGEGLTPEQVSIIADGIKNGQLSKSSPSPLPVVPPYDVEPASTDPADVAAGAKLFARHCAECHGKDGRNGTLAGALNDPVFLALISDRALRTVIITGRADLKSQEKNPMPSFVRLAEITPQNASEKWQELDQIVAYIASWRTADAQASLSPLKPNNETER